MSKRKSEYARGSGSFKALARSGALYNSGPFRQRFAPVPKKKIAASVTSTDGDKVEKVLDMPDSTSNDTKEMEDTQA